MIGEATTAFDAKGYSDWMEVPDSTELIPSNSVEILRGSKYCVFLKGYNLESFEATGHGTGDVFFFQAKAATLASHRWKELITKWFTGSQVEGWTAPSKYIQHYFYPLRMTWGQRAKAKDYLSIVKGWAAYYDLLRAIQGVDAGESGDDEAYFDALDKENPS